MSGGPSWCDREPVDGAGSAALWSLGPRRGPHDCGPALWTSTPRPCTADLERLGSTGGYRLERRSRIALAEGDVERHHEGEANEQGGGREIGVMPALRFRDQLLDDHKNHSSGRE